MSEQQEVEEEEEEEEAEEEEKRGKKGEERERDEEGEEGARQLLAKLSDHLVIISEAAARGERAALLPRCCHVAAEAIGFASPVKLASARPKG